LEKKGSVHVKYQSITPYRAEIGRFPATNDAGQRRTAVKLIRKRCSNYDVGNCLLLDDGDTCVCVQSISYSVCCKFFRHVLLEDKAGQPLKAEIFRDDTTKRCLICGKAFQAKSNNTFARFGGSVL